MAYDGHLSFDTKLDEKGFTSGVGKLGGIAKSALGILGGAVAGVTGAMGAGVAMGVKYNADMQNYFSNFETMLGSADAATAHVQQLKEFAAKTPFEMSDLAQASKTLLAFGTDADDVMPIMKMLGDVSLGNKDKFNSLSLVFGQVSSQGKLMGQDLLQMINAGFNPLQVISEKTGESMASLKDRMSKGEIGIDEVTQAFQWATEEGGKFAGGMEKASQTFDGLMSTLKDNAMSLLGEVVAPITDQMTNTLLPAAIDAVDQLSAAFQEGGVEQFIAVGAGLVADIATGIAEQLPSVIETAISFLTTLIDALNENASQLVSAGGQLLTALISGIMQLLPSLLQLGLTIILNIVQGIMSSVGQLTSTGQTSLGSFITGLLSKLPELIAAGGQILNQLLSKFLSVLPDMLSAGVKILGEVAQGILNNLPAIIGAIASVIAQLLAEIASHLPEMLQKGIELLGEVAAGLIKAIPDLLSTIPEIFSQVKAAFTNLDWLQIGKDIVNGIANGIKNAASAVWDAAKSVAKSALDAAKGALGIHSPSRVFRDEVGKNIALGLADGITRGPGDAEKSAAELAKKTFRSAKKHLGGSICAGFDIPAAVSEMEGSLSDVPMSPETYGNEGNAPGYPIDYERMGEKMREAVAGVELTMDKQKVGSIVSEPVNDRLGEQSRREGRDMV